MKWHWVRDRLYGPEQIKGDGPYYTGINGTLVQAGLRERIAALLNAAEPGGDLEKCRNQIFAATGASAKRMDNLLALVNAKPVTAALGELQDAKPVKGHSSSQLYIGPDPRSAQAGMERDLAEEARKRGGW